jgi:hypothetical protein
MFAIRQSAGTIPEDIDWLKMNVRTSAISKHVSFGTRGDMSSGPSDFLGFKPESNFINTVFSDFEVGHIWVLRGQY